VARRPLCVCHLQVILDRSQAQVSQHLARMKKDGLVEANRHQNWMIYSLPKKTPQALHAHLQCLQDCVQTEAVFKKDLLALKKLQSDCCWVDRVLEKQKVICG
jgi:ArsR family transcriptional regulator